MALPNRLPSPPRAHASAAPKPTPYDYFDNLRTSYLTMLEKPASEHTSPATASAPLPEPLLMAAMPPPAAPQSSPFLTDGDSADLEMYEFVNAEYTPALVGSDSPSEETPLFTPFLDTPYLDFDVPGSSGEPWISPALVDASEFPDFGMPLFAGDNNGFDHGFDGFPLTDKPAPSTTSPDALTLTITHTDNATTTELFTMPSTPSLPSAELFPSPPAPRAKAGPAPTGHRKGMSAAAMIPLDAPTQPRTYYTDSKTSRKAVPAAFAAKRKRDAVDDEDEDVELEDAIAAKRRQNTLAARRSRQRKAETAAQQEEMINRLREDNEHLRRENAMLRAENDALLRR